MSFPIIKKRHCSSSFALAAAVFFLFFSAFELSALSVPSMRGAVNDYARMLGSDDIQLIENYLQKLNRDTGVQIAVLTIPGLEGESIEAFSIRTVEEWKLGQKEKDNGVLLLVAAAEKKIRIEVGYGLEGVLTDMQSGSIIRNLMAPYFKSGEYGKGIAAAVQNMAQLATAGYAGVIDETLSAAKEEEPEEGGFLSFVVLALFFLFMMSGMRKRGRGYGGSGLWKAAVASSLLSALSSRSSGFSGRSSGGFGGFSGGGGGFGGGGASGGW